MKFRTCIWLTCVYIMTGLSCSVIQAQTVNGTIVISGAEELLPNCGPRSCTNVWAGGTVSITANGSKVSTTYRQGSTPGSLAASLCSQMTSSFPVQCTGTTSTTNSATLSIQSSSNVPISTFSNIQIPVNVTTPLFTATVTGFFNPFYQILSIVYTPPGDHSQSGFANTNSTGTSTSIGSDFASGSTVTYSATGGLIGQGSLGVTFGVTADTGNSQAYQVTYSSGTGSQLTSVSQDIDHSQDQFFLWLNPQITVNSSNTGGLRSVTSSTTAGTYSVSTVNNQPMDIVNVNVAGLQNPSLIPLSVLLPQTVQPGVVLPGLASICANPLPPNQCTQANACGCVPSDFTAILAADPLIGVSELTPPSAVDSSRFVFVTSATLEGPQQAGGGTVLNGFNVSDSSLTSSTETERQSTSTSYSSSGGINIPFLFTLTITNTSSFTLTNTESQGVQNGSAHQASVTLGSDKVGCDEHVDIYEDTAFHTFAFALPATPPTACQ